MAKVEIEKVLDMMGFTNFTLDELQEAWGEWADKTFPHSDLDSIASHFREEAVEFAGGLEEDFSTIIGHRDIPPTHDPVEAADCLLLMLHHAHKAGYNLMEEALKKAKINIERDWDTTDEGGHGHFKHKEKDPEHCDITGVHTEEDGKCKYCGISAGGRPHHECRYGQCRVSIYDPSQDYCDQHESQRGLGIIE